MVTSEAAVVPGYYLVCYNLFYRCVVYKLAVVPGYYLVCYNPLVNRAVTCTL